MASENFQKSANQVNIDSAIIDKRISLLTEDIITDIKNNAGIDPTYEASIFRPKNDLGMLVCKKCRKSPSEYTLNLLTLKPTINSSNKTLLSDTIKSALKCW